MMQLKKIPQIENEDDDQLSSVASSENSEELEDTVSIKNVLSYTYN